jgi:hypothetical protein
MNSSETRLGALPYVIGGLSFIPLVGIPFGLAAVIWGLATKKSGGGLLALIGSGGIAFTVLLYGGLFYFGIMQRGGIYDDLRRQMAQSQLNSLVPAIEFYKVGRGVYPESLKHLQDSLPKDSMVFVFDAADFKAWSPPRYFYYERVGTDHYYLRGVGPDGLPFTADDVVPQVDPAIAGKIGLLVDKR